MRLNRIGQNFYLLNVELPRIRITSAYIYCSPILAEPRIIRDNTTIDRATVNRIVDQVIIQVENIYKALKNGLIDGLIGLGLYKLLKNEVALSEKTKEQLRQLNGPDFNLEFEMTYR